ncbi:MAG: phosphogluconate dehydrogenase (NAD(+)-dependent, decarboxylating) [Thiohalospira sp.]
MRLAMLGLGRMGGNMARRLAAGGVEVIGWNRSRETAETLAGEHGNIVAAQTMAEAVAALTPPRVVWIMLPAGEATEAALMELGRHLAPGDIVVDGGNADYRESLDHGRLLGDSGVEFVDAGVSGGVWGLEEGYCLMVGGSEAAVSVLEPALRALAPAPDRGWAHVGPVGAGHFTKMVHNGIEYGMMQAFAEGFDLLERKAEFGIDPGQVAELWRHGSVVRSWLLDLMADFLGEDTALDDISPWVADSGEGRWTVREAVDSGVPAPVLTAALYARFASQDERGYQARLLARLRQAFGGHAVRRGGEAE